MVVTMVVTNDHELDHGGHHGGHHGGQMVVRWWSDGQPKIGLRDAEERVPAHIAA